MLLLMSLKVLRSSTFFIGFTRWRESCRVVTDDNFRAQNSSCFLASVPCDFRLTVPQYCACHHFEVVYLFIFSYLSVWSALDGCAQNLLCVFLFGGMGGEGLGRLGGCSLERLAFAETDFSSLCSQSLP